jgi:hypothetical protein
MAKPLTFTPLSKTPHCAGLLECQKCGYRAISVWPERTPMEDLQCGYCDGVGVLLVNATQHAHRDGDAS